MTITADHTKVIASKTNTTPTSATASSSPATAGPTKNPMLWIMLDATFAALSCVGVVARLGRIAACAGRNTRPTTPTRIDSAYTGSAGPSASTTITAASTSTTRSRSAEIITRRRSNRSASVATNGARTAIVT